MHRRGVEYLARLEGFEGDTLPGAVVLERGFSETTGFFKESKGRGLDRPHRSADIDTFTTADRLFIYIFLEFPPKICPFLIAEYFRSWPHPPNHAPPLFC